MKDRTRVHPIFELWPDTVALAEAIGYNADYLWGMVMGRTNPPAKFRRYVAATLGLPESELFLPEEA